MRVNDIVEAARFYEEEDVLAPGDAMLSVLIDLFTGDEELELVKPETLNRAWEKFTVDLSVPEWRQQSQVLCEGIDVLAANLQEAGDFDLALELRALRPPRLDGVTRTLGGPLAAVHGMEDDLPRHDEPALSSRTASAGRSA